MAVYLFLIGFSVLHFLLGYASGKREKTNRNTILFFFIGMMILIWLRAPYIGSDTRNYLRTFERASRLGFSDVFEAYDGEYGYYILNTLIARIYDNERFFLLCIALVSVVPVMCFYKKYSENALITIGLFLMFLFSMYFSGMRQICAMAFAFPAYYAAKEKKIFRFALCVIAAMMFHTSAFALALLYPVYHAKIKKNRFILLIPIILFVYWQRANIFLFLLDFMPEQYGEDYAELTASAAIAVLLLMILLVMFTYITADEKKLDPELIGLRNLLVLSMVLQIFASINNIAMRLNYYYLLFVPVTISRYVHLSSRRYIQVARLAEVILSVFFIIYFISEMYTGTDILNVFPYEFYFQNQYF